MGSHIGPASLCGVKTGYRILVELRLHARRVTLVPGQSDLCSSARNELITLGAVDIYVCVFVCTQCNLHTLMHAHNESRRIEETRRQGMDALCCVLLYKYRCVGALQLCCEQISC